MDACTCWGEPHCKHKDYYSFDAIMDRHQERLINEAMDRAAERYQEDKYNA